MSSEVQVDHNPLSGRTEYTFGSAEARGRIIVEISPYGIGVIFPDIDPENHMVLLDLYYASLKGKGIHPNCVAAVSVWDPADIGGDPHDQIFLSHDKILQD